MGLMGRTALLGALNGGATAYNQIRKEERETEQERQKREEAFDIWQRQQDRIEQFGLDKEARTEENERKRRAEERAAKRYVVDGRLVDSEGKELYAPPKEDDRRGLMGGAKIKDVAEVVELRSGTPATRESLRKAYEANYTIRDEFGGTITRPGAPSFTEFFNAQVKEPYRMARVGSSTPLASPPTDLERALARERLKEKDDSWFGSAADDEDAVLAEVARMRLESRAPQATGEASSPQTQQWTLRNGQPVRIR